MKRMKLFGHLLLTATLSSSLLLTGCGKDDLPNDIDIPSASPSTPSGMSDDEIRAALPKIMEGLEEIKEKLATLQLTAVSPDDEDDRPSTPNPKPTTKPATGSNPKPTPTPKPTAKPATGGTKTDNKAKGQADFQKMLGMITNAQFIEATVEKTEKNLKSGKVTTNKLKLNAKKPNTVFIHVLASSSGSAGVKLLYTSGVGDKLKIRPNGALSFVTTDLPKTDERVLGNNGYKLDDNDFFGVAKRLGAGGYAAELIGTTSLSGTKINIIKITTSSTNSLDSRIAHEYIGYEPDTYKMRLWELYDGTNKDPFFRLTLSSINFPSSLPESAFKL